MGKQKISSTGAGIVLEGALIASKHDCEGFTMSLDKEAIQKLGRLARIAIDDQQASQVAGELSSVLDWVEQLQQVNVEGVAPMSSVLQATARLRKDVVDDGHRPDRVLDNAPQEMKGYFAVPKVIE